MKPRITFITLGVDDLERSLRFYRDGLGLPASDIIGTEFEHGSVVFIDLDPGVKLALYPREHLAWDAQVSITPPSPSDFSLANNVGSKEEVDAIIDQAKAAGAPQSYSHPRTHSGVAIQHTSRTRTDISGRLRTTPTGRPPASDAGVGASIDSTIATVETSSVKSSASILRVGRR